MAMLCRTAILAAAHHHAAGSVNGRAARLGLLGRHHHGTMRHLTTHLGHQGHALLSGGHALAEGDVPLECAQQVVKSSLGVVSVLGREGNKMVVILNSTHAQS